MSGSSPEHLSDIDFLSEPEEFTGGSAAALRKVCIEHRRSVCVSLQEAF